MVLPLSTVSMLFGSTQSSGGVDFSFITRGASGASTMADAGSTKIALTNAAKNEARQLADVAKERKPLEMAKKKEQIDAKQKEIYAMVKPTTHKVTISPK